MWLKRLFSLTNPRYLREEYRSKATLLNNISLFTIGMCMLLTLGCFIFHFRQGKIIMSSCTISLIGIYYYFRTGGGLVACSNLYLSVASIVILLSCYYSGLFTSPVLYWSVILPMYAFWILGTRYGFLWLCIALLIQLTVLTFGTLNIKAAHPFDFYASRNVGLLYVLVVLLITNIAIFCYDFETGKIRALFKVESEKTAIAEALQRLELTRQKLEKAEKHKDLFLSQMSHEMRTPMNAIVGLTNLMLEQQNGQQQHDLEVVNQSAKNLLGIIDDILDITRVQSGKFSFNYRTVETAAFFNATFSSLRFKAQEKNLDFLVSVGASVPTHINTDPVRLAQIINNIAGNAIKFTSTGHVTVNVHYTAEAGAGSGILQLEVVDTGIGIPEEKLEAIFEVFRQADDETYRKYGGTGLGLSITRLLTDAAGGSISIASQPYAGTTVKILFPVKEAAPPSTAKEPQLLDAGTVAQLQQWHVLLVDDYEINRQVTIKTLHSEVPGMQIDEAANGQEAIDLLGRNRYNLVLMDVQMPVMDGLEATRWIRNDKNAAIQATPIIGLTSYAMKEDERRCREAGMDDYLSKPFEKKVLFAKMMQLAARKPVR